MIIIMIWSIPGDDVNWGLLPASHCLVVGLVIDNNDKNSNYYYHFYYTFESKSTDWRRFRSLAFSLALFANTITVNIMMINRDDQITILPANAPGSKSAAVIPNESPNDDSPCNKITII